MRLSQKCMWNRNVNLYFGWNEFPCSQKYGRWYADEEDAEDGGGGGVLEAVSAAPGGGQGEQHEDGGEGGQTQQQHDVVPLRPRPQTCPAEELSGARYLTSRGGYCCRAGSRRRTPRRRGRRRAARGTPRSTSPAGTRPRTPAPAAWGRTCGHCSAVFGGQWS